MMKRLGLFAAVLVLLYAAGPLRAAEPSPTVPAASPGLAALGIHPAPQAKAAGCPLYYSCRWYIDSGCECEGFWCNDQFICGVPIQWSAAPSPSPAPPVVGAPELR